MTKGLQKRFNELVNGEGTRYAVIIDALRKTLKGIPQLKHLKYGCIAFYNYNIANKNMYMRVFPFDASVIELNFPQDIGIQIPVLERINKERFYDELHHLNHFRENFKDYGHFKMTIADDSKTLSHSKEKIHSKEWSEIIADFESSDGIEPNRFDLLFFKSRVRSFVTIPLPVLSSPAILLILPDDDYGSFLQIIERTKEAVDFFLYNRLIKELGKDLDPKEITSELMFVKRFIEELAQVIVPIHYTITKQGETIAEVDQQYFKWFEVNHDCLTKLELNNLAGYKVEMTLATFCIKAGMLINRKEDDNEFMYGTKEEQVVVTLENIFQLVYNFWKTSRDVEDKILQGLKARIKKSSFNKMNIGRAMDVLKKLIKEVDEFDNLDLPGLSEYLKDAAPSQNSFVKTDRNYQFTYKGKTFTVESGHKGFECLFHLMSKGCKELTEGKTVENVSWENLPVKEEVQRKVKDNAARKTNKKKDVTLTLKKVKEIADSCASDFTSLLSGLTSSLTQDAAKYINDGNGLDFKNLLKEKLWPALKSYPNLISPLKKCLDELKQSEIVKQEQAESAANKKISQFSFVAPLSIKVNFIHKKFEETFATDYTSACEKLNVSEDVKLLRQSKGNVVFDSKIRDEITKTIDSAFERFIFKNISEPDLAFLKTHFEFAGLYKPKGNGRDTSRWKYDQSSFAAKDKIEWEFRDRTIE